MVEVAYFARAISCTFNIVKKNSSRIDICHLRSKVVDIYYLFVLLSHILRSRGLGKNEKTVSHFSSNFAQNKYTAVTSSKTLNYWGIGTSRRSFCILETGYCVLDGGIKAVVRQLQFERNALLEASRMWNSSDRKSVV